MRIILRNPSLIALVLLLSISVELSAQFSLSVHLRPRMEFRNGFRFPGGKGCKVRFFHFAAYPPKPCLYQRKGEIADISPRCASVGR